MSLQRFGWGVVCHGSITAVVWGLLALPATAQDWVTYSNETSVRLPTGPGLNTPALSTTDTQEKDYAWDDVDHDNDIDLVVVRKQPFTTTGRRQNVLFMNEGTAEGHTLNGVLVDRTAEYIPGFLDETADRDVVMADVNGDGWVDIVTAPTYGQGLPTSISHPRIYINQGEIDGQWQGYIYEQSRFPTLPSHPNFCGVAAGDIDNDNDLDLYFTDYDLLGLNNTFDDRLVINDGNGFFTDQSTARMTAGMLASEFGINCVIADMNGDGWNDIVKNENGPVKTMNNAGNGFFDIMETTYGGAAYFFNIGFIDEPAPFTNATLDIVISDDGTDRWLRNTGNGGNGMADYSQLTLPSPTGGFGSNSMVVDLNNDGWNDIIIADVDVDASGCSRVTDILRNNGNAPNNTFSVNSGGIPQSQLNGVHDFAPIDIDQDGWLDLVIGRCSGTQVWMNAPPVSMDFSYPNGLPSQVIAPGEPTPIQVMIEPVGDALDPDSAEIHVNMNRNEYVSYPMIHEGGNLFTAELPAGECLDVIAFYFTADLEGGLSFRDPPDAPSTTYNVLVAAGSEVLFSDTLEGDTSGWSIINDPELTSGGWELADPNGTLVSGQLIAPDDDATPDGVMAFVTGNGLPGESAGVNDVDGGPTYLISPPIDLSGTDAFIFYAQWFVSHTGIHDQLITEVSNDGGESWVQAQASVGTGGIWEYTNFLVSDYVVPTADVVVRFSTCDCPNDSFTEAGIDDFSVEVLTCNACAADLDSSGSVDAADLAVLLGSWGSNPGSIADLNGDDIVDAADLAMMLGSWGEC